MTCIHYFGNKLLILHHVYPLQKYHDWYPSSVYSPPVAEDSITLCFKLSKNLHVNYHKSLDIHALVYNQQYAVYGESWEYLDTTWDIMFIAETVKVNSIPYVIYSHSPNKIACCILAGVAPNMFLGQLSKLRLWK